MIFEKFEVFQHGVAGEADFSIYADGLRFGVGAFEFDALPGVVHFDAVEPCQKIEVPEFAAELAIGNAAQADRFFFGDEGEDGGVFHLFQGVSGDLAGFVLGARFLQLRRAQQTADHVGAERRNSS